MSKLVPVVIDFETFWDTNHSLTKMSPIEYVMSPKTEIISCAAKTNGHPTLVCFGESGIRKAFENFDWSDKLVIAHNMSGFDAMILAWRFGVKPRMWGDTMCMARPRFAKTTATVDGKQKDGVSLGKLVQEFDIGVKDQTALFNTKGKNLKDFTPEDLEAMRTYNAADVDQCWELFKKLRKFTSNEELRLIDTTIRMLVEPQFKVDQELLRSTLEEERQRKHDMLVTVAEQIGAYEFGMTDDEAAEAVSKTLGSAAKFGKLLESYGVEVPTKISQRTGKEAPALAKTDEAFIALQEHENPVVAAAAQARLGVKSTILESRIEAFLQASEAANGYLPVTLKYAGADTTQRWSGWAYNPQNLPRVS